jgi:hypothetical protein
VSSLSEGKQRVVGVLSALVLVRIALPLVLLASTGTSILGLPAYHYDPRPGDAFGYQAAVRELLATPVRLGWALPAVVALVAALVVLAVRWRRRSSERPLLALLAVWCVGAIATLFVLRMRASGAVTIGWPLVWSLPLFPYRATGLTLNPDVAFGFGLAVSLAANAVTVVATYLLGLWASGRTAVGVLAAALFSFQPLLFLALGRTEDVGTWQVDLGLHLYAEPVSTALVVTAAALLVRGSRSPLVATAAGALLGLAVTVRVSNAVIAATLVGILALRRELGTAVRVAVAGLAFLPVVIAYWPMGYPKLPEEQLPDRLFALDYAADAWRDSLVWGPLALAVLVPPAVLGVALLPRRAALLLAGWIVSTALFYTVYRFTPLHPRFLLVALPALYVLWSAAVLAVTGRIYRSFIPSP